MFYYAHQDFHNEPEPEMEEKIFSWNNNQTSFEKDFFIKNKESNLKINESKIFKAFFVLFSFKNRKIIFCQKLKQLSKETKKNFHLNRK